MNKVIVALMLVMGAIMNVDAKDNAELLAISLIAKYEGFSAEVYPCPGGHKTIGYGFADPSLVARGHMTRAEADKELGKIVRNELEFVNKRLPSLTAKQKAAVVSFIFNFGRTKFLNSKYYAQLKAGNMANAKTELLEWCNVTRINRVTNLPELVKLDGLVKRRTAEAAWLNA